MTWFVVASRQDASLWDNVRASSRSQARAIFTEENRLSFVHPLSIKKIFDVRCPECGGRYDYTYDEPKHCPHCQYGKSQELILREFLELLDGINQQYDLRDAFSVGVTKMVPYMNSHEHAEYSAACSELRVALDAIHAYLNGEDLSQL